jgi:BolA protein
MNNNNERLVAIKELLTKHLAPTFLEVTDNSYQHVGHVGHQGAGHFAIVIAATQFSGKSRLEIHRLIHHALRSLMPQEIHALQISIKAS